MSPFRLLAGGPHAARRPANTLLPMTDDERPPVPRAPAPAETLIIDAETGRQLLRIDGLVTLPVGARIELAEPRSDAVVTAVRLWGAAGPRPVLVLDVFLAEPGGTTDLP